MISSGVSFTLILGPSPQLPQFTVVNPSTFTYINAIAVAFIQISLFFEAVGVSLIICMVLLLGCWWVTLRRASGRRLLASSEAFYISSHS